jgi:hypothetical protein
LARQGGVCQLHPSSFASIELQYKLAARVGRDRSFRDFVHVLLDRACEPRCLNRAAKAPQVDGVLRIDDDLEARAQGRICPQNGTPLPGSKVTLPSKIIAGATP